ncbi:MAG: PKD domain-containing protein, partial [Bacteroidales bacterium]
SVTGKPVAGFTYSGNCEDETAQFTDQTNTNGGGQIASRVWDFGDPSSGSSNFSTLQNPTHVYSVPGVYLVTLITANYNGCSDTARMSVNVNAAPVADFTSTTGCVDMPTTFTAIVANPNAIANYLWNFGDGGSANTAIASHNYNAQGNYLVTLTITDTTGCTGQHTETITINPSPLAHFTANSNNCVNDAIAFTNHSTTTNGYINSWTWNFGDGNTQTILFPGNPNISYVYTSTGTFIVTLTVVNSEGCTNTEQKSITVNAAPIADFIYQGGCVSSPVSFTDLSTVSGNTAIAGWLWNFGDPTSGVNNLSDIQNPVHTFNNSGTYVVQLIVSTGNGCSDTATMSVTVKQLPPVEFTSQGACEDSPVSFIPNGTVMNLNTIATWLWQFGDGSTGTQSATTHQYNFPGTYTVTLTVTDTAGCSNSISHQVLVVPLPLVNFDNTSPSCQMSDVDFTDLTSTQAGYIIRWTWNFGDGNSQTIIFPNNPNVTHSYAISGSFAVTLTVKTSDSCTNYITKTINIFPKPDAQFTHGTGCENMAMSFFDQSESTGSSITSWLWNFGDPASGISNTSALQNPVHTYSAPGTYLTELIVTTAAGCSDTISQSVIISPSPVVDFSFEAGCDGSATHFTSSTFVNMATTQSWQWNFGDGTQSALVDPVHFYNSPGTFAVTLTITDFGGCNNTITKQVIINARPIANFTTSTPACSGTSITFTDLTNVNGGTISEWHWTFGDGTDTTYNLAPAVLVHTYENPGIYSVTLTVQTQQGCSGTVQQTITISPAPVSSFTYTNTCLGENVQFNDQSSLNGGGSLISWQWNFGDPASGINNTSTLANPTHVYPAAGNFVVTLVVTNATGCSDSIQTTIDIHAKPLVDFTSDSITCLGSPLNFNTDITVTNVAAIQTYNWNFGDGSADASQQNATHTYLSSGIYTVTLTITDTSGCENSVSHQLVIHALPNAAFSFVNTCEESITQFTDMSTAPSGESITTWSWDFGIAASSTDT